MRAETIFTAPRARPGFTFPDRDTRHRIWITLAALAAGGGTLWLAIHGFQYYVLDQGSRPFSPLHRDLRPGSPFGLRLGMLGLTCFVIIYLYPLRKRWSWLMTKGKTTRWLDYHVLLGIVAPVIVSFHATFKAGGFAGYAYWTMLALTGSGIIGRYLYSQIPRSLDAAESSLKKMDSRTEAMIATLESRGLKDRDYRSLVRLPSVADVHAMSVLRAVMIGPVLDCRRVLGVWRARRRACGRLRTVMGVLASVDRDLESALAALRNRALLGQRMLFLSKTERVFYLWHVVHRPFSMSFAVLVLIHVAVVVSLGYF